MERSEMLTLIKEKSIQTPSPANRMKTVELEAIVNEYLQAQATITPVTLKSRILELGAEGKNKTEIQRILTEEGWGEKMKCGTVRYGYIFIVLKDNEVTVPKASRKKVVEEVAPEVPVEEVAS